MKFANILGDAFRGCWLWELALACRARLHLETSFAFKKRTTTPVAEVSDPQIFRSQLGQPQSSLVVRLKSMTRVVEKVVRNRAIDDTAHLILGTALAHRVPR